MKWSYKSVHFELKKEGILGAGFLDESEIEQELNEFGRSGWELISVLEVQDGIIAFFKQPIGLAPSFYESPEQSVEEDDVAAVVEDVAGPQEEQFAAHDEKDDPMESEDEHTGHDSPKTAGIGSIRIE